MRKIWFSFLSVGRLSSRGRQQEKSLWDPVWITPKFNNCQQTIKHIKIIVLNKCSILKLHIVECVSKVQCHEIFDFRFFFMNRFFLPSLRVSHYGSFEILPFWLLFILRHGLQRGTGTLWNFRAEICTADLWVRIQTSLKKTKWATRHQQQILARRRKIYKKT